MTVTERAHLIIQAGCAQRDSAGYHTLAVAYREKGKFHLAAHAADLSARHAAEARKRLSALLAEPRP